MITGRVLQLWLALLPATVVGCASASGGSVERAENGRRFEGRYVSVEAYAWYARGANLEARGDLRAAEAAYSKAAEADPESGSIRARIGALRCAQGRKDAVDAFADALFTENDTAVVLIERGRCSLHSGHYEEALEDGRAAVSHAPDSIQASLLVVNAYLGLERPEDAERWLDALSARSPGAPVVAEQRAALARARGDVFRARRAAEALDPEGDAELVARGREAVDHALYSGELALARARALTLRMSDAELALRAVALGRAELGLEQARLVLDAAPGDESARVAELSALEQQGKLSEFVESLATAREPEPQELEPLAVLLFGELLERRSGVEAARAWRTSNPVAASHDPLVEKLRRRALEASAD